MYVATASPRPKRSAFDSSRGGMCPVFPPLGSATGGCEGLGMRLGGLDLDSYKLSICHALAK